MTGELTTLTNEPGAVVAAMAALASVSLFLSMCAARWADLDLTALPKASRHRVSWLLRHHLEVQAACGVVLALALLAMMLGGEPAKRIGTDSGAPARISS